MPPSPPRYAKPACYTSKRYEPAGYRVIFTTLDKECWATRHRRSREDPFRTVCGRDLVYEDVVSVVEPEQATSRSGNGWCKDCRTFRKPTGSSFTKEQLDRVVHLYSLGFGAKEIGEMMHCNKGMVLKGLRQRKVKIRPRGGGKVKERDPKTARRIEELYWKEELTIDEIAQILRIDRGTVRLYMKRFQIPQRTNSEATRLAWKRGRKQQHEGNRSFGKNRGRQVGALTLDHQPATPEEGGAELVGEAVGV